MDIKFLFKFFIVTVMFGTIIRPVHSQILPPNAGEIQRTMPPAQAIAPGNVPSISIEEPAPLQLPESFKIVLQGWKITGASLISEAESQDKLKSYVGRELGINDLRQAARELATYFRQRGLVVRCFLPEQRIENGIVEIRVIEGRLSDVKIDDSQQLLSAERVTQTITQFQPVGDIVQMPALEKGILLLSDLPGVVVSPVLKPGERFGESELGLKLEPRQLIDGSLYYGNTGMRAVGQNVFGGNLNLNNPFKIGDQASLQVQGGSSNVFGRVSYSLPVGYSGLRVGVRGAGMTYDLDTLFSKLEAVGSTWNGGTFASYPVLRSMNLNLNLQAGFDTRRYNSRQLQRETNDTILNVGYTGFDMNSHDDLLGGGYNEFGFTTSIGYADLSDNIENFNSDRKTARTNGSYQKFIFNASRLQQLPGDFSFWTDISGQMATRNLYSGEKFALGGPYGVRAYPVNEGLGDEGYLAKFELRYKAHDYVQLIGFVDTGGTTLHSNPWSPSTTPNHYTLSGGGVGINLTIPNQFQLNFSVAQRIGSNPATSIAGKDNDGSKHTPHFWLQLSKFF